MTKIDKITPHGEIDISIDAISKIVGDAVLSSYGVAGIVSRNHFHIGDEILDKDNLSKGIKIVKNRDGSYEVSVHVLIVYPAKVTEIVSEAQKKVKYILEKSFNTNFSSIDIYVDGLNIIN